MSTPLISDKAGSGATLTGPSETEAASPVTRDNSSHELSPVKSTALLKRIDGADLLDRIRKFLLRFIIYPSDSACVSHVLWIAHTHLIDVFFTTPRLAVLSSDPGSGKSRLLEFTKMLAARAIHTAQSSPAYIIRKIRESLDPPTLLCDEIDAIFGPKARGNEDLRAAINAGYRRGATRGMCFTEKGKVYTEELKLFCPIALGGLGTLPETITSRSIIIPMRKCLPDEKVETFRPKIHEIEARLLFDELVTWSASVLAQAETHQPILPAGISDRNEDIWSPQLTVADLAGGHWSETARNVALEMVHEQRANAKPPLAISLLDDIRVCFGERDRVSTKELIEYLLTDDEAPWGDLYGRKIDARKLARLLQPYGIKSENIWKDGSQCKGYKFESFHDAWLRYLSPPSVPSVTSVTSVTAAEDPQEIVSQAASKLRKGDGDVTDICNS